MKAQLLLVSLVFGTTVHAQTEREPLVLEIVGRITDGEKKLEGCKVTVYDGNEVVGEQTTDKSGRFGLGLGLQKEFAVVFQREGFLPKRMLVDTRAKIPVDVVDIAPMEMELSMLRADKYEGADTDVLDFPFAIISWNRAVGAFTQDQQYTVDMMRANGAVLLQAGRSVKH